ncbi:MAG: hypothetical protein JSS86_11340 [Cyanobacteria bacterium SZAS LIN-2]|nr:hypothetical protein [Cyanobacteria bacterium SZAS LIN-3]MBS1996900.1 hypothetical protein [Cyanobacteria bacterium SZAS LIN-2]
MRNTEISSQTSADKDKAADQVTGDQAKTPTPIVIEQQWKLAPESVDKAIRDQVSHSLYMDSVPPNFRPKSPVGKYGPQQEEVDLNHPILKGNADGSMNHVDSRAKMDEEVKRAERDAELYGPSRGLPGFRKQDIFTESRQRFSDQAADMIFPGFGRIESKDPNNQWRLDYIYSSRCRTKGLGLCFSMKLH